MAHLKNFISLVILVSLTACGSSTSNEISKDISSKKLNIFTVENSVGFYDLSSTDGNSILSLSENGTGQLIDLDYFVTEHFDWRLDEAGSLILEFQTPNLMHKLTITSGTQLDGKLTYEIHNNNDTIADVITENIVINTKPSFFPPVQSHPFDNEQMDGTYILQHNDVQSNLSLTKEFEVTPIPGQIGYISHDGFIWFINASGSLILLYFKDYIFASSHLQSVITVTLIDGNLNNGTVHLSQDIDLDGTPDASLGDYTWIKN